MLIKDKFNPISFNDYEINKKIIEKYKYCFNKDYIPNILVYGNSGSGKYTFCKSIINTIYNKNIKTSNNIIKIGSKEQKIIVSNYHFEILIDKYNNNTSNISDMIDYITENKEINNICKLKIIIIRNLNNCKNDLLIFLKNKIETCGNNYRFFIITNSISRLINKYRGFFLFIYIPYDTIENITSYFGKRIENFNKTKFSKIVKETRNLNKLLTMYELSLVSNTKPFLEIKLNRIYLLVKDSIKNIDNISKIRDEIYEINIKNLDFNIIIKKLLDILLKDKDLLHDKKHEIIRAYGDYSIRICNSYKKQIHYEALISKIIYIYHK